MGMADLTFLPFDGALPYHGGFGPAAVDNASRNGPARPHSAEIISAPASSNYPSCEGTYLQLVTNARVARPTAADLARAANAPLGPTKTQENTTK